MADKPTAAAMKEDRLSRAERELNRWTDYDNQIEVDVAGALEALRLLIEEVRDLRARIDGK
jgi:hypothetical protein